MSEEITNRKLNITVAGQIALNLDKQNGKNDGKIEKSIWDSFWQKHGNEGQGKHENEFFDGDGENQYISIQNAYKAIMTRLFNIAAKNGSNNIPTDATAKGNEIFKQENFENINADEALSESEEKSSKIDNNEEKTEETEVTEDVSNDNKSDTKDETPVDEKTPKASNEVPEAPESDKSAKVEADDSKDKEEVKEEVKITNYETKKEELKKSGAKFKTRMINGQKQEYARYKDENGNTVRVIINNDGTTDDLIEISKPSSAKDLVKNIGKTSVKNLGKDLAKNVSKKEFVSKSFLQTIIGQDSIPDGVYAEYDKNNILVFKNQKGEVIPYNEVKDYNAQQVSTTATYHSVAASGTGIISDENDEIATSGKVNEEPEKYSLENDKSYKKYLDMVSQWDTKMKVIEEKYNVTRGNLSSELSIPFNTQDSDDYTELKMKYKMYKPKLDEYVKEMNNWKDGPLGNESFLQRGTVKFTNLERITLKNGQRAWKCNEGVFYPYIDGKIGGPRVEDALIP